MAMATPTCLWIDPLGRWDGHWEHWEHWERMHAMARSARSMARSPWQQDVVLQILPEMMFLMGLIH